MADLKTERDVLAELVRLEEQARTFGAQPSPVRYRQHLRQAQAAWAAAREVLNRRAQDVRGEAMVWQPIETAPKDGTCILVSNEYGSWIAKYVPEYQSGYRPAVPWMSMMLNHDHMRWGVRALVPTNWQPLPALRAAAGEPPKEPNPGTCE